MNSHIQAHFQNILKHVYINPLERCNLNCKICYTRKTAPRLTEDEILDFITRYKYEIPLKVVTFCGGEVMLLPYFPQLINTLTDQGLYIQIITNGTINRLDEFTNPGMIDLIFSIDGLEAYHDSNRGLGNFKKSIETLQKSISLGFHHEIFSVITSDNFADIDTFETYIFDLIGKTDITYHPRKPPEYLSVHPISNIEGALQGFGYVSKDQLHDLYAKRKVFPPSTLGCYQISLVSDGKVYGCCEGTKPIGRIDDTIADLIQRLRERVESDKSTHQRSSCLGCSQPDFMCGIKKFLSEE